MFDPNINTVSTLQHPSCFFSDVSFIGSIISRKWHLLFVLSILISDVVRTAHHVTRHNMPIHNILSTVSQLSISQKALEPLPEEGNIMTKHAEATIHN